MPLSRDPILRLVLLILLAVGAPFVLLGLYEIWDTSAMLSHAGRATGAVVANSYSITQDGTTESGAYYPVIEFTTAAGETKRFTDGIGSLPPDYEVGAAVPVVYDPAGVQPPRLASWKRLWFVPTLFLVIGALPATAFGLWLALTGFRSRLQSPLPAMPPGR